MILSSKTIIFVSCSCNNYENVEIDEEGGREGGREGGWVGERVGERGNLQFCERKCSARPLLSCILVN